MIGAFRILLFSLFCLLSPPARAEYIGVVADAEDWRFVNSGGRFLSLGINGIRMSEYWPPERDNSARKTGGYYDVRDQYAPPYSDWAGVVKQRMAGSGFNTAGAWSSEILARNGVMYTHALKMAWSRPKKHRLVDLFEPEYEHYSKKLAQTECLSRANHANLLGYFLDNELPWYGAKGWRTSGASLLELYSDLGPSSPGRQRLVLFLQNLFSDWNEFRAHFTTTAGSWQELDRSGNVKAWSALAQSIEDEWAGVVAERFFSIASAAVKGADPNHLILGCRFVANAPLPVWRAAARYCDVVSVNYYTRTTDGAIERWRSVYEEIKKPILISETSIRATENRSKNPNNIGADCTVPTQSVRAEHANQLLDKWFNEPYIVGVHWFEYADQPPSGRYNGEDSNFGLYDIYDSPYEETLEAWRTASERIPSHRKRVSVISPPALDVSATPRRNVTETTPPALLWTPALSIAEKAIWDKRKGKSALKKSENSIIWEIDAGNSWQPSLKLKSAAADPLPGKGLIQIGISSRQPASFKLHLHTIAGGDRMQSKPVKYVTPAIETGPNTKTIVIPISALRMESASDPIPLNRLSSFTVESMDITPDSGREPAVFLISEVAWLSQESIPSHSIYQAPYHTSKAQ